MSDFFLHMIHAQFVARCGVNRNAGQRDFAERQASCVLPWAGLHFGEEPPVRYGGIGYCFYSGCNLGCPFVRIFRSRKQGMGRAVSAEAFADIVLHCKMRERKISIL
ncbi:hypothetical protein [Treponema phagedenis]|uniref:hypothetical protein n=1 Tax=Treponema phagedenis TaxID=162 RepID=UPI0020914CF3|nr:hypothetical protein [Treponema phagedenis]